MNHMILQKYEFIDWILTAADMLSCFREHLIRTFGTSHKDTKDVSEQKHSSIYVFCVTRSEAVHQGQGLSFTGWEVLEDPICVGVCVDERGSNEGVKIPRRSKINPLSHGLTFTEGWSVGVCEGVAL